MSRNSRVGENGENSAKVWRIFIWGSKGFPLRVAILAKWYIWRIWRTFTKVLAKFQMRWQRGSLKVAILTKKANLAKMAKMAHSRQSLANVPMTWQRLHFESGDFGENGKYCEHPPVLGKIQMRWQRGPLKVKIFPKMASMVRIRQSFSYKSNKMAKGCPLKVPKSKKKLKWDSKVALWDWRSWRIWPIWRKWRIWRTFAKVLSKNSNAMAKRFPLKLAILTEMENLVKIANLANIRQDESEEWSSQ